MTSWFKKFKTTLNKINNYSHIKSNIKDYQLSLSLMIKTFTGAQFFPLVMKLAELYWEFSKDGSEIYSDDNDEFNSGIKLLEKFIIRRQATGKGSRLLTRTVNTWDFNSYADLEKKVNDVGFTLFPSVSEFKESLETSSSLYSSMGSESLKAMLWKIELKINETNSKELINASEIDKFQIEHIMPKTLSAEWKDYLSNDGNDFDYIHSANKNKLGNLTLTKDNQALSNSSFDNKKLFYKESNLKMNRNISKENVWKKDEIVKRTNILAEVAAEIWK